MPVIFHNRDAAGAALAQRLSTLKGHGEVIVLGIPDGGLLVAAAVARALGAPLEAFLLQPMHVAGHADRVIGAVASGGVRVVDQAAVHRLNLPRRLVDEESEVAERELKRREAAYREAGPLLDLAGRTVIVVDEGAITGQTLVTAVRAIRQLGPRTVIAAAPVISSEAAVHIAALADRCVGVIIPAQDGEPAFQHLDYPLVSHEEAVAALARARLDQRRSAAARTAGLMS